MAVRTWRGGASAVAQVATGSIDTVDGTPADNTFTVTIGDVPISVVGNASVNTTATDLRAALNASTHPYFAAITWSGTTGNIVGTADTAGVPFVAALTVSGIGTGTVTDFAATTPSSGPSDWSTADNWTGSAVPVSSDSVVIGAESATIAYGLDQNAVAIDALIIHGAFTGKLGLKSAVFATSADGETANTAIREYRETYLKIDVDNVEIGLAHGLDANTGSGRIKIDNTKSSGASGTFVNKTATSVDAPLPAIRLKFNNSAATCYVKNAVGGVGIACELDEATVLGDIWFTPLTATERLVIGRNAWWTNLWQQGGDSAIGAGNTPTSLSLDGGTMKTEGTWQLTTLNARGGTLRANHWHASPVIATLNLQGGTVDFADVGFTRTITTLNPDLGTLIASDELITFTTINRPDKLKQWTFTVPV